jgi:hypothetical protein
MEIAANLDAMSWVRWKFAGVSEEATASIFTEQENTHDLSFRTEEIEKRFSQNSQLAGRDLNLGSPDYDVGKGGDGGGDGGDGRGDCGGDSGEDGAGDGSDGGGDVGGIPHFHL